MMPGIIARESVEYNTSSAPADERCDDAPSRLPSWQSFTDHRRFIMRRRSVLLSAVSGTLTGALAVSRTSTAQEATPSARANHPIVGAWLVMDPSDPLNTRPAIFAADGTLTVGYVPSYAGSERGVVLQGTAIGVWEPTGERSVHLTYVQALSDLNGTYLGTLTRDAYPEVSEDGQSFRDDGTQVHITFRDAANTIVDEARGGGGAEAATRQVHAMRMRVGTPGFLEAPPVAGTPTI
jgi:hypothetical protein